MNADNSTNGEMTPLPLYYDVQPGLERGLVAFYEISRAFLDLVQPANQSLVNLNFSQFENPADGIRQEWNQLVSAYPGYAACLIVGIIFIVLIPLIGLVLCCAHYCTCCCKNRRMRRKHRSMKPRHYTSGIRCVNFWTLGLLTFMCGGMICTFLATEVLHRKLVPSGGSAESDELAPFVGDGTKVSTKQPYTLTTGVSLSPAVSRTQVVFPVKDSIERIIEYLKYYNSFLAQYLDDLRAESISGLAGRFTKLFQQLRTAATSVASCVMDVEHSNCSYALSRLQGIVIQGRNLHTNAVRYAADGQTLKRLFTTETNLLNDWRSKCRAISQQMKSIIGGSDLTSRCQRYSGVGWARCNELIESLQMETNLLDLSSQNFQQIDRDLGAMANIDSILDVSGIETALEKSINELNDKLSGAADRCDQLTNEYRAEADKEFDHVKRLIGDLQLDTSRFEIVKKQTIKFSNYFYYGSLICASLVFLTLLLFSFGLCCGVCGKSRTDRDCCSRPNGSNWTCCGMVCVSLFGPPLMFCCMVLFAVGGPVYTDLCRPIERGRYDHLDKLYTQIVQSANDKDSFARRLNPSGLIERCAQHNTVYQLLDLDSIFNTTSLLQEQQEKIDLRVRSETVGITVKLPANFNLFQETITNYQNRISPDQISTVSGKLSEQSQALSRPLLPLNVEDVLKKAKAFQPLMSANADSFAAEIEKLQALQRTTASDEVLHGNVKTVNSRIISELASVTDRSLIDVLENCDSNLRSSGNVHVQSCKNDFIARIIDEGKQLILTAARQIRNSIGSCRPLYDRFAHSVQLVCVETLRPINIVWFGLGWALSVYFFLLLFGACAFSLYRRTRDYVPVHRDSVDAYLNGDTGSHPIDSHSHSAPQFAPVDDDDADEFLPYAQYRRQVSQPSVRSRSDRVV